MTPDVEQRDLGRRDLLARNTVLNLVGFTLPLLVGVFSMPPVIDGLGPERFGVLALVWVALGYLNLLDLGLGRAVTKFAAEALVEGDDERLAASVWTAALLQGGLGILGGAAVYALAPFVVTELLNIPDALIEQATRSFQLLALAAPVLALTNTFRGLLEAGQRFDLVNAVRAPISATNFLLPLVGVILGWTLSGIVTAMIVMRVLSLVIFAVLGIRLHPALRRMPRPGRAATRVLLGFGGWVTVSSLINPILIYADRFAIGGLLTVAAVTFYAAPHEVITRLTILPASLVGTLFPAFSGVRVGGRAELERLLGQSVRFLILGVGLALVALTTLAQDLLHLWLGAEFARTSTPVLQLLAVGLLANAIAYVPSALIQARGRPDVTARIHMLELPIHIGLLFVLIQAWGLAGAAAAWSIRMVLDAGLLFWAAHRLEMVSVPAALGRRVPEAILVLLAAAGTAIALGYAVDGPGARIALAVAALVAAGTWTCRRLFSADERSWLLGLLRFRRSAA